MLHLAGVLSGGDEPPLCKGRLWLVRPGSPSAFPDKHCFCGHKSESPREAGREIISILQVVLSFLVLDVLFLRHPSD